MSPRDWRQRIEDILEAIGRIRGYVEGMSYEQFLADRKTIDALELNLMVIGEAAKHVPEAVRARHQNIPWADVVGIRNVVVHQYFETSEKILWSTAQEDLPAFADALRSLLEMETPKT